MKLSSVRIFLLGSAVFFLFVLFSYLVHKDFFTQFDFDTTVRLQDNIPRRFDETFSLFSLFGNFELMFISLIVLLLILRKFLGILVPPLFILFHMIELFGKVFVEHLPPPHFMLRTHLPFEFPQFYVRQEFSYPSGHSGRTMFVSTMLLLLVLTSKKIHRGIKAACISGILFFDFVMLLSRVYLGEHWMTDVIGGALLGTSLGILSAAILIKGNNVRKEAKSHAKS